MPRAIATCRAAGVDAIATSTDVEVVDRGPRTVLDWLPDSEVLDGTSRALRERIGSVVYGLRGWLSANHEVRP